MAREFKLPDIGEGVHEGEVTKWFVKEGDAVQENDPLVEVMTDKVTVQIPSPVTGKIVERRAKEGETVQVGATLVVFGEAGEARAHPPPPPAAKSPLLPPGPPAPPRAVVSPPPHPPRGIASTTASPAGSSASTTSWRPPAATGDSSLSPALPPASTPSRSSRFAPIGPPFGGLIRGHFYRAQKGTLSSRYNITLAARMTVCRMRRGATGRAPAHFKENAPAFRVHKPVTPKRHRGTARPANAPPSNLPFTPLSSRRNIFAAIWRF